MITFDDVRRTVEEIRENSDDPEVAHSMEDALYLRVLRAIAAGELLVEPSTCVIVVEALAAAEIEFDRACA